MKSTLVRSRLHNLSAKLSTIQFLRVEPDEDEKQKSLLGPIGAGAGVVAAGTGGALAHRKIMAGYGGEGGAAQAYKNAGRNLMRSATDVVKTPLVPIGAAVDRGAASYGVAREIGGLNPLQAGARGLKKGLNPLIGKLRGLVAKIR